MIVEALRRGAWIDVRAVLLAQVVRCPSRCASTVQKLRSSALPMLLLLATQSAAGPVEVYREGPKFCPSDRAADSRLVSEMEAVERARSLLPPDFCGPSLFVSGCDADPEFAQGSWRIYVHQYKLHGIDHDYGGLTHSYVILDRVGNCLANIPGTELGARR